MGMAVAGVRKMPISWGRLQFNTEVPRHRVWSGKCRNNHRRQGVIKEDLRHSHNCLEEAGQQTQGK
jgi:hypothetical protein